MRVAGRAAEVIVLGDIGSTFTKLAGVGSGGELLARASVPTTHEDLAAGVERARALLALKLGGRPAPRDNLMLSSSAGGGLRVVVLGYERDLTVTAAMRVSATAGARIVGVYTDREFAAETVEGFSARAADLALLTGGTDGGDEQSIIHNAETLARLAPELPVVVAGNRAASAQVRRALRNGRPVEFVSNVMPRVGELAGESAQIAIRRIFIERVIGHGRLASASSVAGAVRMPTPAAVLAGAEVVASLGATRAPLRAPVVVDIGGATTDVHSVIPESEPSRGYVSSGLPDAVVTRTVEGDLGLRENAEALVGAAIREGCLDQEEAVHLRCVAEHRRTVRGYVAADAPELAADERLAGLATVISVLRHAGVLRTSLTAAGAVLERTGRDLRQASCVIATGGVFEHSRRAGAVVAAALAEVHTRGGLISPEMPVLVDRSYLLWAVGLLSADRPGAAARVAQETLVEAPHG